jgi:hypothetical protein
MKSSANMAASSSLLLHATSGHGSKEGRSAIVLVVEVAAPNAPAMHAATGAAHRHSSLGRAIYDVGAWEKTIITQKAQNPTAKS